MGCCGQKRANLKSMASPPATSPVKISPAITSPLTMPANPQLAQQRVHNQRAADSQPTPGGTQPVYAAVTLRYLESSPIRVRGSVTGQQYEFSGAHPRQAVDARDAQAFLRTRFFRQA